MTLICNKVNKWFDFTFLILFSSSAHDIFLIKHQAHKFRKSQRLKSPCSKPRTTAWESLGRTIRLPRICIIGYFFTGEKVRNIPFVFDTHLYEALYFFLLEAYWKVMKYTPENSVPENNNLGLHKARVNRNFVDKRLPSSVKSFFFYIKLNECTFDLYHIWWKVRSTMKHAHLCNINSLSPW